MLAELTQPVIFFLYYHDSCGCMINAILFQFQYNNQSDEYSQALDILNMIFTGVFTLEFILKLCAFRFKVKKTLIFRIMFLLLIKSYIDYLYTCFVVSWPTGRVQ